ncbi:AdoMet_MTases domain containing protein [Sphingomonadaceae bacterium]
MNSIEEGADTPYVAGEGTAYFQQRLTSRSRNIQALRAQVFRDLDTSEAVVLDFGCGSGGVLSQIPAAERIGIEIGADAALEAQRCGLDVRPSLAAVADNSVDYVISFHALEHVYDPMGMLREMRRVLRPDGKLRLVVPYEHVGQKHHRRWQTNSDYHLFAWTPLTLGNLAAQAGFTTINAKVTMSPTGSRLVKALAGFGPLKTLAHFWASYRTSSFNIIVDAGN